MTEKTTGEAPTPAPTTNDASGASGTVTTVDPGNAKPGAPESSDVVAEKPRKQRRPKRPRTVEESQLSASRTPNLDAAMLGAQREIKRVAKDAQHAFGFDYTRGDTIVEVSREALHAHDCILLRSKQRFATMLDEEGGDLVLVCTFKIRHVPSGEELRERVPWPVVRAAKQGLDKSVAAALTGSFAYWLIGILSIPRSERGAKGADMDAREDHPTEPRITKQRWLSRATHWKKVANAISKIDEPAEARLEKLRQMEVDAANDPFSNGKDATWPPNILAKLRRYVAGYRDFVKKPVDSQPETEQPEGRPADEEKPPPPSEPERPADEPAQTGEPAPPSESGGPQGEPAPDSGPPSEPSRSRMGELSEADKLCAQYSKDKLLEMAAAIGAETPPQWAKIDIADAIVAARHATPGGK